jgi:hypothetical protein
MTTWKKFDSFPMETLTKAWFYKQGTDKKQRDVSLMKEHGDQYGITGNCFDLAIWLLDEFKRDGISAYPIGHDLHTEHAHVAVIAIDESGNRFLCDLGDQWLSPILVDKNTDDYTNEKLSGFFPGAKVQVKPNGRELEILYIRPNDKVSRQVFDAEPIDMDTFMKGAEFSQNLIKPKPLLECRIPLKFEIAHWEFYNWESFLSTSKGLMKEPKIETIENWAVKINQHTGYDIQFLIDVLEQYKELQS